MCLGGHIHFLIWCRINNENISSHYEYTSFKRLGSPGIIHAQLPPNLLDMDACITSQLNTALIRQLGE